jgi:hypothetical protein
LRSSLLESQQGSNRNKYQPRSLLLPRRLLKLLVSRVAECYMYRHYYADK